MKDKVIRNTWTLFQNRRRKRRNKKNKHNKRIIKDRKIRDIWIPFEDSLRSKYQLDLKTSMSGTHFIFDSV